MTDSEIVSKSSTSAAHKQKRAQITRDELIRSARTIFARDGFEHARIEEIALRAGKTRGAFYANFKDKEDVFFAIFEENIDRDIAELAALLLRLPTEEQKIKALGEYLSELSKDRQRTLLNLEFKLYAIRHPRKRKRLADLYALMCLRCSVPELDHILPKFAHRSKRERLVNSLAIGGVIDGLALNHLFDPDALDHSQVTQYIKLFVQETLL